MARLRPLVIPAAALALATATPSAQAQQRKLADNWAASPQPTSLAALHADAYLRAETVQPAIAPLPFADLTPSVEAAIQDARSAAPQPPVDGAAAGRPTLQTARGPP